MLIVLLEWMSITGIAIGNGRGARLSHTRQQKREIRAFALSWPDKKISLSQAAAQSVLKA